MITYTIILVFWIIVAVISASIQVASVKKYTKTNQVYWILISILASLFLTLAYVKTFNGQNISVIYPLIKILCIISVIITGVVFFNEKLSIKNISGIVFGVISIYLLAS
jgi:multidrug transporter EmrE-like cation transporter